MKYSYQGLNEQEVQDSRKNFGSNELEMYDQESFWNKLLANFKNPIIIISIDYVCVADREELGQVFKNVHILWLKVILVIHGGLQVDIEHVEVDGTHFADVLLPVLRRLWLHVGRPPRFVPHASICLIESGIGISDFRHWHRIVS